jgi:WHG domain-containing protein
MYMTLTVAMVTSLAGPVSQSYRAAGRRRALTFWTRLHGVISLEVAGHFTGMKFDPALLYAAETEAAITTP